MNFYLTCVVVSLVFWGFRSVHEKCEIQEFGWLHYLFGFSLCLVPVANIVAGIFFVEYGIRNIRWLRWVEWLLEPLYRLMFIVVYDTSAKEPVTNQKALDATWVKVADEGQSFSVPSSTLVQYGADTTFASSTLSGDVVCSNEVFGDPLPGAVKACYVQQTAPATPVVGDGIHSADNVSATAYRSMAAQLSTDAGIAYR